MLLFQIFLDGFNIINANSPGSFDSNNENRYNKKKIGSRLLAQVITAKS